MTYWCGPMRSGAPPSLHATTDLLSDHPARPPGGRRRRTGARRHRAGGTAGRGRGRAGPARRAGRPAVRRPDRRRHLPRRPAGRAPAPDGRARRGDPAGGPGRRAPPAGLAGRTHAGCGRRVRQHRRVRAQRRPGGVRRHQHGRATADGGRAAVFRGNPVARTRPRVRPVPEPPVRRQGRARDGARVRRPRRRRLCAGRPHRPAARTLPICS